MADTLKSPNEALGVAARAMCGLLPDAEWSLDVTIALAAVRDALEALDAAGWVLVPREATQEMYAAAIVHSNPAVAWEAMLAAAPKLVSSS